MPLPAFAFVFATALVTNCICHDMTCPFTFWHSGLQALGTDTKAGRLLNKLYGQQKKVEIQYPGLRVVEGSTANRPAFVPGGGKHNVDARTNKVKRVEVLPDYHGKPRNMPAPVQYLQRRKNKVGALNDIALKLPVPPYHRASLT